MPDEKKTGETSAEEENAEAQVAGNPDGGEQTAEEETSNAVFEDAEKASNEGENARKGPDPEQVKRENAENARRRRETERKREIERARDDAIMLALGGKNPYTDEPMKDHIDVEEYLAMKKISDDGGDPVTDYRKAVKRELSKRQQEQDEKERKEEWYREDREDFRAKHPDVDLSALTRDRHFVRYAEGKIGTVPLSKIYEGYRALVSEIDRKAAGEAAQHAANAAASPGALSQSAKTGDEGFYTKEQVEAMSKEEIKNNYDKIRASMSKWR